MTNPKSALLMVASGAALLAALTGCVSYVEGPPRGVVYAQPQPAYIEGGMVVQDDYVYYPSYQVYYSPNRHQYMYLEGRNWVTRTSPPRVSVNVLLASPSVRLDFHDSPTVHHHAVVQQYPKHWTPPTKNHNAPPPGNNKDGRTGHN